MAFSICGYDSSLIIGSSPLWGQRQTWVCMTSAHKSHIIAVQHKFFYLRHFQQQKSLHQLNTFNFRWSQIVIYRKYKQSFISTTLTVLRTPAGCANAKILLLKWDLQMICLKTGRKIVFEKYIKLLVVLNAFLKVLFYV